jgi:hypothetical protein
LGNERREATDMIRMFVGNDDAVQMPGRLFNQRQTPQRLALAQSRIHQKARARSLQQRAVARAARRENADAKADAFPRCRKRRLGLVRPQESSQSGTRASTIMKEFRWEEAGELE